MNAKLTRHVLAASAGALIVTFAVTGEPAAADTGEPCLTNGPVTYIPAPGANPITVPKCAPPAPTSVDTFRKPAAGKTATVNDNPLYRERRPWREELYRERGGAPAAGGKTTTPRRVQAPTSTGKTCRLWVQRSYGTLTRPGYPGLWECRSWR